jgi:hypothetical protein
MLLLVALAACGSATSSESFTAHDACAPLAVTARAATDAQHDGIAGALALWRDRGASAFDPAAGAPPGDGGAAPLATSTAIAIEFDAAAATFHGIYDPAADRVLINRDLTDPATLAIVIAHELGHVFGLVHIAPAERLSLMNPGNLITAPTDADQRALEALWGACH